MRKRRRLANKMTIMVCAVLIAVSAFFYAPMEVDASSFDSSSVVGNYSGTSSSQNVGACRIVDEPLYFDNVLNLDIGQYYLVTYSGTSVFRTSVNCMQSSHAVSMDFGGLNINLVNSTTYYTDNPHTYIFSGSFIYKAVENAEFSFDSVTYCSGFNSVLAFTATDTVTVNIDSIEKIQTSDGEAYQNGYNAGFTDGESAGYGNGYSQGFTDGEASVDTDVIYDEAFQAGKDSVDTQSYYDAGYQAGYQVAYSEGYASGYAEGLKSVQSSPGSWGAYKFIGSPILNQKKYGSSFYIAPFGLDDMEEYQNGSNGYYHNTVPTVYDGYSVINYLIPLDAVTQIDSDTFNFEMNVSNMYSGFDIDTGSGSFKNSLLSSEIEEVYLTFNGQKYYGNVGKFSTGSQGFCNFSFIVESDVSPTELNYNSIALSFVVHNRMFANIDAGQYKFVGGVCSPYVGFDLGSSAQGYSFRVRPYVKNDRVSANIQNQTDQLTNGYDDSKGNQVNSDLSTGLNDYETAENSLFATATTGMKDFTFFDFESVPAMITGMSFIGSIMGSWFNQAGGASGVGIVLSILFSVILVAMVLGLYRWYQSRGGKD